MRYPVHAQNEHTLLTKEAVQNGFRPRLNLWWSDLDFS